MAQRTRPNFGALLTMSQLALGKSQTTFGQLFGVSRGTIARWQAEHSGSLLPSNLIALVQAVHPVDPALAADLALAHGQTLEGLGIVAPGRGVQSGSIALEHLVDIVVCAAAEIAIQPPSTIRPALRAAFERAKAVGLSIDDVLTGLGQVEDRTPHLRNLTP